MVPDGSASPVIVTDTGLVHELALMLLVGITSCTGMMPQIALPLVPTPSDTRPPEQGVGVDANAVAVAALPPMLKPAAVPVAFVATIAVGVPRLIFGSVVLSEGTPLPLVTSTALFTGEI